jgi:hypothetical protein
VSLSALKVRTAAAAIGIAAAGVMTAVPASAAPQTVPFGKTAAISGAAGTEVADYTVNNVQPTGNNDGTWYSDVTVTAGKGDVTPIIGDFNARAGDGTNYTTIEGTNPDGLTNQPIAAGQSASGRIYFQVNNGPAPNSVVYSIGGTPQVIWKG